MTEQTHTEQSSTTGRGVLLGVQREPQPSPARHDGGDCFACSMIAAHALGDALRLTPLGARMTVYPRPRENSTTGPTFTEHELDLIYDALENYRPSEHVTFTEDEIERVIAKIVPPYAPVNPYERSTR